MGDLAHLHSVSLHWQSIHNWLPTLALPHHMHIAVAGVATGARVPSSRSCRGVSVFGWLAGRNTLPPRVQIGRALGWVFVVSGRCDSSSSLLQHAILVSFLVSNWPDNSIRFGPRFPIGLLWAFPSHRPTGGARTLFELTSASPNLAQSQT